MDTVVSKVDLIKKAGDINVLPFVARKILDALGDDSFSISDLEHIIETDQALAVKVLKISNSALYGLPQEITSLKQALMVLGLKAIKSLVLSISTRSLYKKFGITEQKMWDHSLGAAFASWLLSTGHGKSVADIAFIGGLMHDLGKVFMNNETPDAFSEVMMKTYNDNVVSIDAEEEIYGFNHAEIGAALAGKWGFPTLLVRIIEMHHLNNYKLEDISDEVTAKGVACVNLANFFCKSLGIGYREPDDTIELHILPSAVFLNISRDRAENLKTEIINTYEKEKSVFE
jgi:putative nucleotidyltransferase with HDIG domain